MSNQPLPVTSRIVSAMASAQGIETNVLLSFVFTCLRGQDSFWRQLFKSSQNDLGENVTCEVDFGLNRQLGWKLELALASVWAV